MMEKNGTMLPGEIYKDLGYVSALSRVVFITVFETSSDHRASSFKVKIRKNGNV